MDALASYIVFQDQAGVDVGFNMQNYHAEQSRVYIGRTFMWGGFGYTGSSVDLNASNTESQLVFAINPLVLSTVKQAVDSEWIVQVNTVWLDPDTLDETADRLTEIYTAVGYQTDTVNVTLRLGSPLDAQSAEIPSRVLTRKIAGQLPATGQLSFI